MSQETDANTAGKDIAIPLPVLRVINKSWDDPEFKRRLLADPVSVLLAREHLECVLAALPSLTAKERTALVGVLNDKSHQQLADEQGLTRKVVSIALRRARNKLAVPDTLAA